MPAPFPIPDLNLNLANESRTGDLRNANTKTFSFAAPVINRGLSTQTMLIGGAFVAAYLIYKRVV
jgi:hypothetical protein